LERRNRDFNIVNLRDIKNDYRLLIVPGHVLMDEPSAATIRKFVEAGGAVIMTGYSATLDETAKAFPTPKPGRLADVFGIRIAGFFRTDILEADELLQVEADGDSILIDVDYYEELKLASAESYATFADKELCAISKNRYGEGRAYYMATEANAVLLDWLIERVAKEIALETPLETPEGVCARKISENQTFYLNTTKKQVSVPLLQGGKGVLTGENYTMELPLNPFEGELIVGANI
jgi:beta-galactosidase